MQTFFGIIAWIVIILGAWRVKGCLERNEAERAAAGYNVKVRVVDKRMPVRHASSPDIEATYAPRSAPAAGPHGFDPIHRPEDVVRIIEVVANLYGVPKGILYGIWRSESSEVYGDRGGAGGYKGQPVLAVDQYAIRDKWISRRTFFKAEWFRSSGVDVNDLAHVLGPEWEWSRIPFTKEGRTYGLWLKNGEANLVALKLIAARSGWDWRTVWASRGDATMEVEVRNFGGCLGPTQITPVEWLDDPNVSDRDPLDLYWGLVHIAVRLKKTRDLAVKNGLDEYAAWSLGIRKYAGNPGGERAVRYDAVKVRGRWTEWETWKKQGILGTEVSEVARRQGAKWRQAERRFASR